MKVMVIVKATKDSEAGVMPGEELLTAMGNYNEELVRAGVMLAGEGLHPSSKGARVRFAGKNRSVIDGPFAETKELIAGFWLWQVKSLEEAIEWVKRCPNPHYEDCELEIRQVFAAEDFGAEFTPALREQEAALRAKTLGLEMPRFEDGKELLIAGLNERYTFETRVNIPAQWGRFCEYLGKVPGQVGQMSYGVSWNCEPKAGFDYLAGVEVSDTSQLPAGFSYVKIAAQRYAVFVHLLHVSKLPETIDTIWRKWVPDCGLATGEDCIERYTAEFNPATGLGGMEIWIPLKS
ncbi:GyrI-like domain-containing protein [Anatilimnocola floriformis]|uniref:GyrI-like domain-containing protein n=1 Tax=Anatilimnocola floriformis TaxID=2948575 RepID=UPI0020C53012|nr:GyrI-like domain-containing protein [Anatilimnocola floriformis]